MPPDVAATVLRVTTACSREDRRDGRCQRPPIPYAEAARLAAFVAALLAERRLNRAACGGE